MTADTGIPGITTHARKRMAEIHGRDLTRAEWLSVLLTIIERRCALLMIHESGADILAVPFGAMTLHVVYDPKQARIRTILPSGTPTFEAAYVKQFGTMRPMLQRDRRGTWHRGSKIKNTLMVNRNLREHGRWEDDGE